MVQVDTGYDNGNSNFGDICQLLNLIKEVPGSNICYKNTEGIILWHNNYSVQDLKQNTNINGKTAFNLFSPTAAQQCMEHDIEVIDTRSTVCKHQTLELITGDIQEYFIIKTPWLDASSGAVGGIILSATNISKPVCQQFKTCYASNNQIAQLQNLYFNFKQPLKEILLLVNLIMSRKLDNNVKHLCLEIKNFATKLLSYCNQVFTPNENVEQIPLTLNKINLRKLVKEIFNKQIKSMQLRNTKLFLTVSNRIPEIIISDLLCVNKVLQLIMEDLLKSALNFNNMDIIKIYCKIELFHKINNRNVIVSLIFEVENYLFNNFLNDNNSTYEEIKQKYNFLDSNDNKFRLCLVNALVKEVNGDIELINNKANTKIAIHYCAKAKLN